MVKKSGASKVQSRAAGKPDNQQLQELARNLQSAADKQASEKE